MMKKKAATVKPRRGNGKDTQLPSAPLAEVVFELRWQLQPGPFMPYDPLLMPLISSFTSAMERAGFSSIQDIAHPQQTGAFGIARRFRKGAERPYPLMQIGPGIFAANESAEYSWKTYKQQVLNGVKAVFASYPTSLGFPFHPGQLELRYVDVFDKTVLGHASLFDFLESATSLRFKLPVELSDSKLFWGDATGRLSFQKGLRGYKDTNFAFDIVPGQTTDTKKDVVQLTSRVISTGVGVPTLTNTRAFLTQLGAWLEFAHSVTSPFFKEFILPDVKRKFTLP